MSEAGPFYSELHYAVQGEGTPSYTELVEVKSTPDLGGAPELLDKTTLKDIVKTYTLGLQDVKGLEFTANYNLADYNKVKALAGQPLLYRLYCGDSLGTDGIFEWSGSHDVYPTGRSVNNVPEMKITIANDTEIIETSEVTGGLE